jgi:hypothetical protein
MSNSVLTISMITREAMRVLENNLTFTRGVNREYDDKFGREGAKIGSTLNVRLPARYVGRTGPTLSIEDQTEQYIALTLGTQFGVDVQFTSADLELSMDDFSERFLAPAMAAVSNKIDFDGMAQATSVYNAVGTPGTTPSTILTFLNASKVMKQFAAPQDDMRSFTIDPNAEAAIVNNLTTLFVPQKEIGEQYLRGQMGNAIGFKWSSDANVNTLTQGSQGGTPVTKSATTQTGSSLITTGWSNTITNVLVAGDIFTISGIHAVNPQTRKSTGALQQFVVTANANSNGSGTATLSISPSMTSSGQFQTIDTAVTGGLTITVLGSASATQIMNLAYHRDAFILGTADLPLPKGVDMAARVASKKTGLSVRMVRAYDIVNDMFPCRLDVLYGWATPYPQLACRICG